MILRIEKPEISLKNEIRKPALLSANMVISFKFYVAGGKAVI
jgi:hypothetical protein